MLFIIWLEPLQCNMAGILASGLPRILEHKYGLYQIDSIRLLFIKDYSFSHDLFVLKQFCKTFL